MCSYCDALIKCPVGYKAKSYLSRHTNSTPRIEMIRDNSPRNDVAFIHACYSDEFDNWHNSSFHINYCPVCGTKICSEEEKA